MTLHFKRYILCCVLLFAIIASYARQIEKVESASDVLSTAIKEASTNEKKILIIFTASWCVNCRILKDSLLEFNDEEMKFGQWFADNYIIKYMVTYEKPSKKKIETPGADSLLLKYSYGNVSLPFFIILDKSGVFLENSYFKKKGNKIQNINIGRPYLKDEVMAFIRKLRSTSRLNNSQLKKISERCNPNL